MIVVLIDLSLACWSLQVVGLPLKTPEGPYITTVMHDHPRLVAKHILILNISSKFVYVCGPASRFKQERSGVRAGCWICSPGEESVSVL